MPIEVEGPDGAVITFPDGTARNEIAGAMAVQYLDYGRPQPDVRADIAKLDAKFRKAALAKWADTTVEREAAAGGVAKGVDDTVRTIARGTFLGSFADEANAATNAALNAVTGGRVGAPYDETLAYQRAKDKALDASSPVLSTAGQVAGALAGGGAAMKAGGSALERLLGVAVGGPLAKMAPAATLPGRMAQGVAAGATYGAAHGAGSAEGDLDQRLQNALKESAIGGAVGGVATPLVEGAAAVVGKGADLLGPTIAKAGQGLENLRDRFALKASASSPRQTGSEAAADRMIADQLQRAGVTPGQLQNRLAEMEDAVSFGAQGRAQNVLAPADLDPSLARLAGSVMRQQPEAGGVATGFQLTRQTGRTNALPMPEIPGLPSRAAMTEAAPGAVPMGQYERVRDALRRALIVDVPGGTPSTIRTAHQTEQAIVTRARQEARQLYDAAYRAGQGVDLAGTVEPIIQRWTARMADEPAPVAAAIRRATRMFTAQSGPVGNIQRIDKAKQFLDGQIEQLMESPVGRNRYLGGVLTEFKNEILSAVDAVPNVGSAYRAARNAYADNMTMRDALRAGREAFRENSEVGVDQYRALATDGERRLFRLGLSDSFEQQIGRNKRTADITQVFENPRIEQMLQEIIPAGNQNMGAGNAQKFGRYLQGEKSMISTRDATLGNSKTAERMADDRALEELQALTSQIATRPSATGVVMSAVEASLNRLFGIGADTASAVAHRLFTADPRERAMLLSRLEGLVGPSRMQRFTEALREQQALVARGASSAAGSATGGQ